MTREEFIQKWGASMGHGFTDEELSADLDELLSLPPAEGAEPITEVIPCYACQGGGCPVCSGCGTLTQLAAQQQPTAEGAEEILVRNLGSLMPLKYGVIYNKTIDAMQEFATLHAQRLAEKMVSERLREELIAFQKFETKQKWTLRAINPPEFYVDEYLKSRESHEQHR